MKKTRCIRMSDTTWARLQNVAAKKGESPGTMARWLIDDGIDRWERDERRRYNKLRPEGGENE